MSFISAHAKLRTHVVVSDWSLDTEYLLENILPTFVPCSCEVLLETVHIRFFDRPRIWGRHLWASAREGKKGDRRNSVEIGTRAFVEYQHVSKHSLLSFLLGSLSKTRGIKEWWISRTPTGISWPQIIVPGRSTSRGIDTGDTGCKRIASRITAWRYGSFDIPERFMSSAETKFSLISCWRRLITGGFFKVNQVVEVLTEADVSLPAKTRKTPVESISSLDIPSFSWWLRIYDMKSGLADLFWIRWSILREVNSACSLAFAFRDLGRSDLANSLAPKWSKVVKSIPNLKPLKIACTQGWCSEFWRLWKDSPKHRSPTVSNVVKLYQESTLTVVGLPPAELICSRRRVISKSV